MEGPGERLCVGEPGRLSLEETEWWRPEEKLRLLCITVLPFDSFFRIPRRLHRTQEEGLCELNWRFSNGGSIKDAGRKCWPFILQDSTIPDDIFNHLFIRHDKKWAGIFIFVD